MSRFVKGQSGNPGGRPRGEGVVRELAQQQTSRALQTLVDCLNDPNGRVRVAAANSLLDRGWGRAPQSLELSAQDNGIDIVNGIREARKRARSGMEEWQEQTRAEITRQVLEQQGLAADGVVIATERLPSYDPFDERD